MGLISTEWVVVVRGGMVDVGIEVAVAGWKWASLHVARCCWELSCQCLGGVNET